MKKLLAIVLTLALLFTSFAGLTWDTETVYAAEPQELKHHLDVGVYVPIYGAKTGTWAKGVAH